MKIVQKIGPRLVAGHAEVDSGETRAAVPAPLVTLKANHHDHSHTVHHPA
jgi:hypothetical protein